MAPFLLKPLRFDEIDLNLNSRKWHYRFNINSNEFKKNEIFLPRQIMDHHFR